jgi:hypothetical protein
MTSTQAESRLMTLVRIAVWSDARSAGSTMREKWAWRRTKTLKCGDS